MAELIKHIKLWLSELDEQNAVNFLSDCTFDQTYVDTLFEVTGDSEIPMFDIIINVPLKKFRQIENFNFEISVIENAIIESARADRIHVRTIEWNPYLQKKDHDSIKSNGEKLTKLLTHEYVSKQIQLMHSSIENYPHLALGTAKELIETCCKHILSDVKIEFDRDWDIAKLVKTTNLNIDLIPFDIEESVIAKSAIAKILGGISNIVHGISELRNAYGTGHGHIPDFKNLDSIYIKLAVSTSSQLAIFYLSLHNIMKENNSTDNI